MTALSNDADHTYDLKGPDGVIVFKDFRPGRVAFLPYWRTSYGGNNRMQKLNRDDSNKVLLLDYNKILADVIGPNSRDNWLKHSAPRHSETVNVLFMDGHTETRDPAEIERSAGVQGSDRRSLLARAEEFTGLGVTLLTVGTNGPDYDLAEAEALCRWRDDR